MKKGENGNGYEKPCILQKKQRGKGYENFRKGKQGNFASTLASCKKNQRGKGYENLEKGKICIHPCILQKNRGGKGYEHFRKGENLHLAKNPEGKML